MMEIPGGAAEASRHNTEFGYAVIRFPTLSASSGGHLGSILGQQAPDPDKGGRDISMLESGEVGAVVRFSLYARHDS